MAASFACRLAMSSAQPARTAAAQASANANIPDLMIHPLSGSPLVRILRCPSTSNKECRPGRLAAPHPPTVPYCGASPNRGMMRASSGACASTAKTKSHDIESSNRRAEET
jgi:hypothetical protein